MKNLGVKQSILAASLAAGLLITGVACREDMQSPSSPESAAPATAPELATAAANSWTARASMATRSEPHSGFSVSEAPNASGQSIVYVFGGEDDDGETRFGGFTYNVATDTWGGLFNSSIRATNMNGVGRIGPKFYMTGGSSCCELEFHTWNKTWMYSTTTSRMVPRADMPRATRQGVTGVIKGQLYVLPGWCSGESIDPGHCATGAPIRQLYRYNPSTNAWTALAKAPHFHTDGAGAVINDKFYVVGRNNLESYLDVYNPATNTWRTYPDVAPIPIPGERLFGAAILGKFYVLSWTHLEGQPVITNATWYDPATNRWTARAAPPNGIAGPIVKVMLNGQPRLFLPGGHGPSYLYTP